LFKCKENVEYTGSN